ncbi:MULTISPECIES: NAD(P)/FAD-dependent oxidoreductase [unclassified Pseudarthrobacter]|uniref:NAD(P)/FAD-dependent oxidoreductase n=1 Tax=unclassified Pseudarthrobacter TaxID=2647000 RepID=UPI0030780359
MKIVVIGAGMIGVSIAAECAERGAEVVLVDKAEPGSGTSSVSYAWVNSNNKEPSSYYALNRAGMAAHYKLANNGNEWFRPTGHVEFATSTVHADQLQARLDRLRARGYEVEKISGNSLTDLVPDLIEPQNVKTAAYFPHEGHCFPRLYVRNQLQRAQQSGVRLLTRLSVEALTETPSGVKVHLSDGTLLMADHVISAVGRWTNTITAAAGIGPVVAEFQHPGDVTVGYLATTNPLNISLTRVLTTPELNIRPHEGGRLLLQALDLDTSAVAGDDPDLGSDIAKEFIKRLRRVLRNTDDATINSISVGQRAMPLDGLSIIGVAPAVPWLYMVATHSGVTLAPYLGPTVAAEVMGEKTDPLLDNFRPARLLASGLPSLPLPPRYPGQQ